ncbi:uncharacterized protein N7496_012575 [Penicillium cataractarum]|uniref:Xylanolytic transcriptional activator regulatory domain-containing protein n=1 Tax=Penicillium cataractarum TaxID=2100454 RepID=A0A9W9RD72_9EURO|nr:uncharacterized protein N7496_012575 [Penicillium cataractarum]KAJ5355363.1 hypothetical protein N7496_012575 [Penicillium cataractarum]
MELTWLADTPQSRTRARALKACPACQRRKKRCRHLTAGSEVEEHRPPRKIRGVDTTLSPSSHGHGLSYSDHPRSFVDDPPRAQMVSTSPLPTLSSTERFVGDLNPEAVIRERLDESIGNPLRDRVGLWISSPDSAGATRTKRPVASTDPLSTVHSSDGALDSQTIAAVLSQRYTSAMQACTRLPLATREPLAALYFSKVNQIIPLVDQTSFTTPTTPFLERAICLVAAKHPTARPHLRLTETTPTVSPRHFCSEIYKGLVASMNANLEPDRYTRIRILALMSLHCEGYEGAEAASLHLCEAIHQAQTVGLHLDRPGREDGDSLSLLFWGLWTLDKMHASLGGRPVILADRDIGIERPGLQVQGSNQNPNQSQSQSQGYTQVRGSGVSQGAFKVWLAVSELLATVISFYRPSAGVTSGWEEGFPAFEDIVSETGGDLDFATLGFLELYYHCVAILSCRYKLTETLDNTKLSSIRQGLAAIRIHSIIASECAGDLPPLPIVPYALSLSMGVSYRQLRSSRLITHFDRAKASLEASCALLEDLSAEWYSAEAMARLGRKALLQIDGRERRGTPGLRHDEATGSRLQSVDDGNGPMISGAEASQGLVEVDSVLAPVVTVSGGGSEEGMGSSMVDDSNELDSGMHGFADIDTLFGEFLDLSLPTNFWDPIFVEDNHHTM